MDLPWGDAPTLYTRQVRASVLGRLYEIAVGLEALARRDQPLEAIDAVPPVQGEGEVEVDHGSARRAARSQAQADPHVLQHRLLLEVPLLVPGAAHVVEHGAAQVEHVEELAVAEDPLLGLEEPLAVAGLIAQRIAPQAGIAAQQDLGLRIELLGERALGCQVEEALAEVPQVVPQVPAHQEVLPPRVAPARAALERGQEELP